MGSGKPTSFDIAYEVGVSQSTVSRALRNSPLVKEETRRRVQDAARRLNYQVDQRAAGLRSQRSRTLAVLLFEDPTSDDSQINPFFLSMLSSITRAAAGSEYDVLLAFQQLSDDWHMRYEVSNRADGIILLGYGDFRSYREKLEHLELAGAHYIIWGPAEVGKPSHAMCSDNAAGAADATRHLIGLGRRRIAFLGTADSGYPEFRQRFRSFQAVLREAGLETGGDLQYDAGNLESAGHAAAIRLLDSGKCFDSVLAASDLIAVGAIRALTERGLRIPQDVAVVGFDDIPAASYVRPSLTTVRQDTIAAGRALVENVIRRIEGEDVTPKLLRPHLTIRESCGAKLRI
jgi:DNA-binding LacI/PurR family transcriptional regulator